MGVRSYNLGQDCNIDITSSSGATYSFSTLGADLISFDADPEINIVAIKPISNNGKERRRAERTAWKGTIVVSRINGDFERLEEIQTELYQSGEDDITFTIHQTVKNKDGSGSQSEYQFPNATLWLSKGGNYKMGDPTMLSMEFKSDPMVEM